MSDRPESAGSRPTPVRVGVPRAAPPAEPPPPRRSWTTPDGATWTAEVAGRGRTGGRAVAGADLLLLVFRPGDHEGKDAGGAREAFAAAESLDELSEDALDRLLERARPFDPRPEADPDFFEGTRRGRRG